MNPSSAPARTRPTPFLRLASVLLLAFELAAPLLAQPATLRLFIWSEYIEPSILQEFEKAKGCKVVVDLYDDADAMLAKIQGGGAGLYDVAVPPDYMITAMRGLNLLAELPRKDIRGFQHLDPRFLNLPFDPSNRFSVPFQWGTVGILARKSPGRPIADSWAVVFDPARQPGPFLLIDSMRDLIGAGLKYQGSSLNSTDPTQLKATLDLLSKARDRAIGFESSVAGKNRVLAKTAAAAIVYSGEAVRATAADPETVYILPREGTQIWLDNLVILKGSRSKSLAAEFISFILDPQIGAKISQNNRFATPNLASKKWIPAEDLANPAIYPPTNTWDRLEFLKELGTHTRIYDEVWTRLKSK